jgi:cob(I)alamin adenosyltransferase
MDMGELIGLIGVVSVVFIPSLAFAARFALKPIVESILRLREGFVTQDNAYTAKQIDRLEREIDDLRSKLEHLESAREFDRALGAAGARQLEPALRREE